MTNTLTPTQKAYNNIGALTDIFGDDTETVLKSIEWYMAALRTKQSNVMTYKEQIKAQSEAQQVYQSGRA